jgi:predicted enzyme related to lactoylglutathione lyase
MPLPADARAPAAWLPYIGVPDVDAAVMRAEEEGAVVAAPPADIPETGRFAVLEDPFGANFAVYRPDREPAPAASPPGPGEFCWFELATTDVRLALEFYRELFGWTKGEAHDMGELGVYQLLERHGRPFGGFYRAPQGVPPAWLAYVRVGDLAAAVAVATAQGGRILVPPHEVPGGARIVVAADPDGAAIALHEMPAG